MIPRLSSSASRRFACVALAATLALAIGSPAQAQAQRPGHGHDDRPMYKWVDEQGVTHYGDAVPPQYADQEKLLLNAQGVQVGSIAGRLTPQEAAREAAKQAEAERMQAARERDQHLLATYLSVEEIENLRDRRFEILDGQARVTQQYLENLRGHEHVLLSQVQHYRPYSKGAGAGPLPDPLAEDLVRTESDIHNQERNLDGKRQEAASMRAQFDSDIARFRELKKAEAEQSRAAPRG